MPDRPRRIRVDLFDGPPPYDKYSKEDRSGFWLLRPHPEKKGTNWILTILRKGQPKTVQEGKGWENGSITLLGETYQFAEENWEEFQKTMGNLQKLPPKQMLTARGYRPVTVKRAMGQVRAEWQRFLNHFNARLERDIELLKEGGWPLPDAWPLPWE